MIATDITILFNRLMSEVMKMFSYRLYFYPMAVLNAGLKKEHCH